MIIALAGRRIDSPEIDIPVFPDASIDRVRARIHGLLQAQYPRMLVSSAACGADLVAQEAAGALAIRSRIILPFERNQFRKSSVVDRPGNWGPLFDRVIAEAESRQDLISLNLELESDSSYLQANQAILDDARSQAAVHGDELIAVLVWNCKSRGAGDITNAFGNTARSLGFKVLEWPGPPRKAAHRL